ncbi:MAG TPA: ATP-binding protein, partial [Clostridia bacterium]|nr:ATP-binding protein [Clostridia bacterium]
AQDAYEELVPLLARLVQQSRRIDEQRKAGEENAQKVAAITKHMAEGLMMVDNGGRVLSVNESAKALMRVRDEGVGQHYMALCRHLELHSALEKALSGEMAQTQITLDDRIFHLLANPVFMEGRVDGAIALFLDITERERAETTRREFSANVSHELKTPLTIVAGYAEMIQTGLSDVRDHRSLAEKIHNEAMRLLTLIEDIIALSKLDEIAAPVLAESVDLYALAQAVLERLEPAARDKGVALSLEGEPVSVLGTPAMLEEMLQNLVDNAISYNKPDGRAGVRVSSSAQGPLVTVWDTGIGIARAHHARVFERFYRVDKSRSRETGGTGLGLSIVKHCAQIHGATLRLDSEPGKGTAISVQFPRQASPAERDV